ncbi:stationary-phase-induced ribosome-associated protein [Hafnia sp.]|uniref:stationary-phase-induced ribosome-associated protein n=1 Tax=Hafnia sp. TaxID=1873498 RepID=UPI002FCB26F5
MANRTANRKARRLLGMSYRISNKPNNIAFLFPIPDFGRFQLPEHLQSHEVVAVKPAPYTLMGMLCDGYGYYPVRAFYPSYISAKVKVREQK